MLDLTKCDESQLDLVRRVAAEIVALTPGLDARNVMIVGAACRDVLHSALGHDSRLRAPTTWMSHSRLPIGRSTRTSRVGLPSRATSAMASLRVAGLPVDLLPFGSVEDPTGRVTPEPRNEGMSVRPLQRYSNTRWNSP